MEQTIGAFGGLLLGVLEVWGFCAFMLYIDKMNEKKRRTHGVLAMGAVLDDSAYSPAQGRDLARTEAQ